MKKKLLFVAGLFISAMTIASLNFYGSTTAAVPGNNELVTMKYDNSQARSGVSSNGALSRDGNFAVFYTNSTDDALPFAITKNQIAVRNLQTGTNELASVSTSGNIADQNVEYPYISENGQYIVFDTTATNLVSGLITNGFNQTYIRDTVNNTTSVVSVSASGSLANEHTRPYGVSNDGRFVLFSTWANNLGTSGKSLYIKDMQSGSIVAVDKSAGGVLGNQRVGPGARDSAMSCDGSFVAFTSSATNLTPSDTNGMMDVFLADLRNGFNIVNISQAGNGNSYLGDISCNGSYVTFYSLANNFISGVGTGYSYVYNRVTKQISLVQQSTGGSTANNNLSSYTSVSDYGHVVFCSFATNLSSINNNAKSQTYIRNIKTGVTEMLSINTGGLAGNGNCSGQYGIDITSDGKRAMYLTSADNLTSTTDSNSNFDFYLSETGY